MGMLTFMWLAPLYEHYPPFSPATLSGLRICGAVEYTACRPDVLGMYILIMSTAMLHEAKGSTLNKRKVSTCQQHCPQTAPDIVQTASCCCSMKAEHQALPARSALKVKSCLGPVKMTGGFHELLA